MKIRPRKGIELAGVPASGADVPADLAREWIDAGLATAVTSPKRPKTPKLKPAPAPDQEG